MIGFLYDTNVFVYALGGRHRYREPCREIVRRQVEGELAGQVSVDLLQELCHQRWRQVGDRADAEARAREVRAYCVVHDLRASDAELALALYGRHDRLDARDAFFAAVALNRELDAILSTDQAFDDLPGLQRIDPADTDAVAALGAST